MRFNALIYSRLDSSRFYAKAMSLIGGVPLLERCINALQEMDDLRIIVATTDRSVDNVIYDLAVANGVDVFRGSLENVAERTLGALLQFPCDYFFRINGDSPFIQKHLLNEARDIVRESKIDFVTNLKPRSFPYGISIELFSSDVYQNAVAEIGKSKYYQEHITSYFYDHAEVFEYKNLSCAVDYFHDIHLTIDLHSDLEKINKMLTFDPALFSKPIDEIVSVFKQVN